MYVARFIQVWIIAIFCAHGSYVRKRMAVEQAGGVEEFFDQIETVMNKLVEESKSKGMLPTDARKERYSLPEETAVKKASYDQLQREVADSLQNPSIDRNNIYNSEVADRKDNALDFEGYQEFVFRPLYPCDRFDAARRYCVFFRQLGTTLTLGVEVGESTRRGVHIYWYRYLKKKQFDHFIREPLNRDYLPWNLNLGGSENELRISPLTETDLSYNYFAAELDIPRTYRERYGRKPTIRFSIEPINVDMGTLYHGEEIIIYARAFMELPRTSVSFLWSLYDTSDLEDRGLPSNMRLNAEKSSVIIKELKTYQSHILSCRVYSNKNVLLARRNFLFRGFANDRTEEKLNLTRHKRDTEETEQLYDDPDLIASSETQHRRNAENYDTGRKSDVTSELRNLFQQVRVPEISEDLFYDNTNLEKPSFEDGSAPHSRLLRSDAISFSPLKQYYIPNSLRRFVSREMHGHNSEAAPSIQEDVLIRQNQPEDTILFEDKESQSIATCLTNSDCNIYATCTRASFSGQNYCKCLHGYNGNGIFCFSV